METDFHTQSRPQSIFRWRGQVCRRLEALALSEATFQFFLFNCEWRLAYVNLGTTRNTVRRREGHVFRREVGDMTEEVDRKVKIEEPQSDKKHVTDRSGHLRQHTMMHIRVLIFFFL